MRLHTQPPARHRDASPRISAHRPLQIATNSPSRRLRTGQTGRCRNCGNCIDWYHRTDRRPLALHPAEIATTEVPEDCRRHPSGGMAHPHDDGSGWSRIPHAVLCPRLDVDPCATGLLLVALRRRLTVHHAPHIRTQSAPSAPHQRR